jgi:hypothetical protein
MSDFLAGHGFWPDAQKQSKQLFLNLRLQQDHEEIVSRNCFLLNYRQPKVIPNIFIKDNKSDSWMMLIGMPLIGEKSSAELQDLLRRLLHNPRQVLQLDIDGHFVLFAFDAVNDRFIVATDFNSFIPVFYSTTNNGTLFCSSELVLARLTQKRLDPQGFSQAVFLGSTWGSTARYADLQKMLPCQIIIVDKDNNIWKESYWNPAK